MKQLLDTSVDNLLNATIGITNDHIHILATFCIFYEARGNHLMKVATGNDNVTLWACEEFHSSAWLGGSRFVVDSSEDWTLEVFDSSSGKLAGTLHTFANTLTGLAVGDVDHVIAASGKDGVTLLYDTMTNAKTIVDRGVGGPVACGFGQLLHVSSKTAACYRLGNRELLWRLELDGECEPQLSLLAETWFAVGLRTWTGEKYRIDCVLYGSAGEVVDLRRDIRCLSRAHEGHFAIGHWDGRVEVLRCENGGKGASVIDVVEMSNKAVVSCDLHERHVVAIDANHRLKLWRF